MLVAVSGIDGFGEIFAVADLGRVVGYDFCNFEDMPTKGFSERSTASGLEAGTSQITGEAGPLTVASCDVLNLDPNGDDDLDGSPETGEDDTDMADGRFAAIAGQIVAKLNAPDGARLHRHHEQLFRPWPG